MRRFRFTVRWSSVSLLALLLIFPQFAASQGSGFNASRQFITTTVASDIGLVQNNHILYHQIAWIVTGSPASCTVALDSSTDGVTWTATGLMGNQTCTSNGNSVVTSGNAAFMRINVSALSNGATLTVNYTGWSYNPNPSSNGGEWGQIANPTQNQVLNMGAFTTAWTFNDIVGGTDIFSISTTSGPGRLHLCGVTNAGAQSFWIVGNTVTCAGMTVSPQANFNVQIATASFTHDAYRAYAAPTGTNYTGTLFQGVVVSTGTGFNFFDFCSGATGSDGGCGAGTHLGTLRGDGLATFNTLSLTNPLAPVNGGTGIASGTSGGILGFTGTGTIASSGILNSNVLVKGGGAGATPTNSSITDDATTVTTTDTGGISVPNGPIILGGDGTHSGQLQLDFNTAATTCPATGVVCIDGPLDSVGTSSIVLQLNTAGQVPLNSVGGAAAVTTATEVAAGDVVTNAGVETGVATYPYVFQNTNSTNNNSSGALLVNAAGSSTGQIALIVNNNATSGHIVDFVTGGTVANGVLSGATVKASITNGGALISGGTVNGTTFQPATNTNSVSFGENNGNTNAALGTITLGGGNNLNTGASTRGSAINVTAGDLTGAATNGPGVNLTMRSGLGTGNSKTSVALTQCPTFSNTSGTTAQTAVGCFIPAYKVAGSTTSATATGILTIPVAASQTAGVRLTVHVETTQATPHNCSTSEDFNVVAQNTGGTITQASTGGNTATICDTGTLTLTATFTTASSPITLNVTPSWTTIVPTGVIISVQIINLSQQDITIL